MRTETLDQILDRLQNDSTFTERTSLQIVKKVKRTRAMKRSACAVLVVVVAFCGYVLTTKSPESGQWNAALGVSRAELATQSQTQLRWAETDDVISSALVNR